MVHIQVDMYSGKLDLSLKRRQNARVTHSEVIGVTELWHLSAEWRDFINLLTW